MKSEDRGRIMSTYKVILKDLKKHDLYSSSLFSEWDIHRKKYDDVEIAARLLRIKRPDLRVIIRIDSQVHAGHQWGYIRFYRIGYVRVISKIE